MRQVSLSAFSFFSPLPFNDDDAAGGDDGDDGDGDDKKLIISKLTQAGRLTD